MEAAHDLFVSYAHTDAEPVHAMVAALRERGMLLWVDDREIADFQSITAAIRDGLAGAKALLTYYSAGSGRRGRRRAGGRL